MQAFGYFFTIKCIIDGGRELRLQGADNVSLSSHGSSELSRSDSALNYDSPSE